MVTRCMWGSRHGMIEYQTGDDRVSVRGRVTTLTSHQGGILYSLIFNKFSYQTPNIKI